MIKHHALNTICFFACVGKTGDESHECKIIKAMRIDHGKVNMLLAALVEVNSKEEISVLTRAVSRTLVLLWLIWKTQLFLLYFIY